MKTLTTIGIDLAKNSFSLYGVNSNGKSVPRGNLSRAGLVPFLANLPACVVGMEACAGTEDNVPHFSDLCRVKIPQVAKQGS